MKKTSSVQWGEGGTEDGLGHGLGLHNQGKELYLIISNVPVEVLLQWESDCWDRELCVCPFDSYRPMGPLPTPVLIEESLFLILV